MFKLMKSVVLVFAVVAGYVSLSFAADETIDMNDTDTGTPFAVTAPEDCYFVIDNNNLDKTVEIVRNVTTTVFTSQYATGWYYLVDGCDPTYPHYSTAPATVQVYLKDTLVDNALTVRAWGHESLGSPLRKTWAVNVHPTFVYEGSDFPILSITKEGVLNAAAQYSPSSGEVKMWGGAIADIPSGYLLCDGAEISRTTYSDLFDAIGVTHGAGDGSTTFNLPDLRNNFVIGAGDAYNPADSGGDTSHNHDGVTGGSSGGQGEFWGPGSPSDPPAASHPHTHSISSDEHLPPYYSMVYMITENDTPQVALGVKITTLTDLNIASIPINIVEVDTGAVNYINKISVYLDADSDGVVDGSETLLGSTTSVSTSNTISLSGLDVNTTTTYILICLGFDTTGLSNTYNFRVKCPLSGISASSNTTALSSTSRSISDVTSNVHTVSYGSYSATLSYNGIAPAKWTSLSSQTVKVLDFSVATNDNLTFNSFVLTVTERDLLDDFTSITLYKDTDGDGLTTGETALETITTFNSDNITFSPGTTISGTTDRYLVELVTSGSSDGTADDNQTFSFKADPVNFDLTQNTITASIAGVNMIDGLNCTFAIPTAVAATTATTTTTTPSSTTPSSTTDNFTITDALVGSAVAGAAAAVELGLK